MVLLYIEGGIRSRVSCGLGSINCSPIYDFLQELRYLVKIAISVGSSLFKILLSYATGCVTQTHFNDESS